LEDKLKNKWREEEYGRKCVWESVLEKAMALAFNRSP